VPLTAVLKQITGALPVPPIGGHIKVTVEFEVVDGKPVLKEGTTIVVDAALQLGEA